MKKFLLFGLIAAQCASYSSLFAQAFTEGFDDITTLPGSGWYQQNNSSPAGTNPVWFQGNPPSTGGPFSSYNGADNSYIACNFNSTAGAGTISNWLLTPNRTFRNGDVISFYTRKYDVGQDYPDRMEVRLSTNGASTNVGASATDLGDFTTLLTSINPNLVVGGYPYQWTLYTVTISGLTAPTSGRIAFRYFITNAGPSGLNSDYIGLDNVVYTPYVCPAFSFSPTGALSSGVAGTAYNASVVATGPLGAAQYMISAGALPPGLVLNSNGSISGTPTATGNFNFTVTTSDASGCSGSQAYSITVVCPPNPISFTTLPDLCSNGTPYTLTEASPSGGTYVGTGISAGEFDPSVGSQTIVYDYTDPYGCTHSSNAAIVVNPAPSIFAGNDTIICSGSELTLSASGGVSYIWDNGVVDAVPFSPTQTQVYTVTGTDANNCSNSDAVQVTVNPSPIVDLGQDIVSVNQTETLTGPAGMSSYLWNTGEQTQSINVSTSGDYYLTVTDANNCSGSDTISFITTYSLPQAFGENSQVSIFPNPVSGPLNISWKGLHAELLQIDILSANGSVVMTERISAPQAEMQYILNVSELKNGIYFVRMSNGTDQFSHRIILSK